MLMILACTVELVGIVLSANATQAEVDEAASCAIETDEITARTMARRINEARAASILGTPEDVWSVKQDGVYMWDVKALTRDELFVMNGFPHQRAPDQIMCRAWKVVAGDVLTR